MGKWEYKNLQLQTVPTFGVWSKISDKDLRMLESLQNDAWEVFQVVNIKGSLGFTAHVLFMLKRKVQ
jgi:hypothetical protein